MKTQYRAVAVISLGALALSACGGGQGDVDDIPELGEPTLGEVPEDILSGHAITFAGDGGETQDAMSEGWWVPFAEVTGATVHEDHPQTLAQIQSQVESGNIQWDFVTSYGEIIERECGSLFEILDMDKIDTSEIPDSVPTTDCGIPSIVYGVPITYNTDVFGDDGPTTWEDFFDTDTYPGTRTFYSGGGQIDAPIVQGAALAAGWDPQEPFSVEWANEGLDLIGEIADSVAFYESGASAQQMLESGDAVVGAIWSGRTLAAEENGAPLQTSWEDWVSVIDFFAIVKGTEYSEAAYYAINFALGAEQQASFTEATGYSPANVNSDPDIDELTQKYLVTDPEKGSEAVPVDTEFWGDAEQVSELQDRWSSIVAGGN